MQVVPGQDSSATPTPLPGAAIITGASRGIGYATAKALMGEGYTVFGCARNPEKCCDSFPFALARTDVTDVVQTSAWIDGLPSGPNDVAVVNHSILGPRTSLRATAPTAFADVLRVNAEGSFNVLHALLNRSHVPRVLCLLTSSVGRHGRAGWGAYSASKFVVESLVQTLAEEFKPVEMLVFAFNPGGTATSMRAEAYPEEDPDTLPSAHAVGTLLARLVSGGELGMHGQSLDYRTLAGT